MDIMQRMSAEGHEQVTMFSDPGSGLKAIIAIHDTTLGPGLRRHQDVALRERG